MKSFKWILPLAAVLLLGSSVLWASLMSFPVTLGAGPALTGGTVSFTLNQPYGSNTLAVSLGVAAGDSAAVVATKIASATNAIGGSTWSALASGNGVTFSYFNGTTWAAVNVISGLSNNAGCRMYVSADSHAGGYINLAVNGNASGTLVGGNAGSSSLTVQINGISSPLVLTLSKGQSAASITSAIISYLNGGLSDFGYVMQNTPTALSITLQTDHAAFTIQTNDSGLQGKLVVGATDMGGTDGGGGGDKHQGDQPPA